MSIGKMVTTVTWYHCDTCHRECRSHDLPVGWTTFRAKRFKMHECLECSTKRADQVALLSQLPAKG